MVLASSIWKQIAPWVYEDANKKKKIQAIPWATFVDESQAMFGSGVAPTVTPPATTTSATDSMYQWLPTPKVATKQNPVVDMSKPKQNPSFNQYDTSAVSSLDMNWLQDFIDQTNIDVRRWTPLTPEREAQLYKAQRRIQELNTAQQIVNPIEPQISAVEEQKKKEAERLALQSTNLIDKRRAELEAQYWIRTSELDKQWQSTMSAAQWVLSFSWFGRSTYAADKQAEIQQNVNQAKQSLQAEKDYAIAKYQAELAGADADTLASYDEQIMNLKQQNTQFLIQSAQAMNEYNMQTSASYEEKINNIFQLAEANNVTDLTEQEKAQASAYWDLLLDAEWNLNTALIKDIPARLVNEAIMQWAKAKGAIKKKPETVELWDELFQLWEDGQRTKVAWNKKEPEWKSDGIGWYWRINPVTGAPEEWNGQWVPSWGGWWGWWWGGWQTILDETPIQTTIPNVYGWYVKLVPTVADMVNNAVIELQQQWINLKIWDSHRSNKTQANAYASGKPWVAPPWTSFHEHWQAIDISQDAKDWMFKNGQLDPRVKSALERAWLQQLPWEPRHWSYWEMWWAQPQWKQYSQSQENILNAMKDKSLWATELKLLKQQWLTANDVYDYSASKKQGLSDAQDINNIILPDKAPEATRKSYSFGQKMQDAHKKLLDLNLEKDFTDRSLVWQWFQENIPSAWKSTKQKDLELLKQAFITWVLRQESWAAITDSEFDRYDTQFFPKQWDTTKTIEKKQQLREQAIRNMYQMAGNDTNWTPIVQIYDKTKQYSTPKEYNASTSYKSGDRFIKDWKTREVGTDGRAYEK